MTFDFVFLKLISVSEDKVLSLLYFEPFEIVDYNSKWKTEPKTSS